MCAVWVGPVSLLLAPVGNACIFQSSAFIYVPTLQFIILSRLAMQTKRVLLKKYVGAEMGFVHLLACFPAPVCLSVYVSRCISLLTAAAFSLESCLHSKMVSWLQILPAILVHGGPSPASTVQHLLCRGFPDVSPWGSSDSDCL